MTKIFFSLVILIQTVNSAGQNPKLNLVPWPVEVKQTEGSFLLKNEVKIYSNFPEQGRSLLNNYLVAELKKRGIKASMVNTAALSDIQFAMTRMPTSGKPAYRLIVSKKGIAINSNFNEPAFHGIQTFLQLIPLEGEKQIPYVEIFDHARFEYRGMHMDVCRHFFPVSYIKKYIDYLAYHKFNTFHWHLTEDQGWRIEIKKYPRLTSIGAWRNGTIIGRYPGTGNTNKSYGGFYTQEQIKEVVQYARERFIEVIPEIEMPGHSSAAIAAYPYLSCFPGKPTVIPGNMISAKSMEEQKSGRIKLVQETWGVFDDVFCAGNDSTFQFLQHVIDEVIPLFSSKYFHIGGDECPKTHWKQCPKCQQRMKELKLKDEHELQSYFVQRIEKYLNSKGKTLIGWDEILEGGLAPNAVVMSWQGEKGGIEAARQDHKVIMTPQNPVYFDHSQSQREDSVTIGGFNPIEKVYAYEPVPSDLPREKWQYILGAQANMWAEYISNIPKHEYMLFPRMSALSEVLWSPKESRDWSHFQKRLPMQFKRFESWGANYSRAYYDLKTSVEPAPGNNGVLWKVESNDPEQHIRWSKRLDEKDPPNPPLFYSYTVPIPVYRSGTYSAWSAQGTTHMQNAVTQSFTFSKATGKKITLKENASGNYPGDGAFTLVNGIINEKGFARSREFLGWTGKDAEIIIDMGNATPMSSVKINALKRRSSWIWEPSFAQVWISNDGENWQSMNQTKDIIPGAGEKIAMQLNFSTTNARYIKVLVKYYGQIPAGNPGAGNKPWLFLDEIEVN